MAQFTEVIDTLQRICQKYRTASGCDGCPFDGSNYCDVVTGLLRISYLDNTLERIVVVWAEDHPVKTNRDALKEVFSNCEENHVCMRSLTGQRPENGCDFNATGCKECAKKWLDEEYKGGVDNG